MCILVTYRIYISDVIQLDEEFQEKRKTIWKLTKKLFTRHIKNIRKSVQIYVLFSLVSVLRQKFIFFKVGIGGRDWIENPLKILASLTILNLAIVKAS